MQAPETKFEIGEILKSKIDDTGLCKYHVIEIDTITCPAGTQICYGCRIHTRLHKQEPWGVTPALFKMNEIEVEKWPEEKKE